LNTFLQQLINGVSQGSAYALIALGYTMVYGVLRLINFAHSDVYMFGAFMGYYLANNRWIKTTFGTSPASAILIMLGAMVLSGGMGLLIERFAYRPQSKFISIHSCLLVWNSRCRGRPVDRSDVCIPVSWSRGRHCDWSGAGEGGPASG
jgi:branched-subunit amino acid ABC-type transport system permease component